MHIKYWIKISIIVLLAGYQLPAQNCKAPVEIKTDWDSAAVYIDSHFMGKGKIETELTPGNHTLLIRRHRNGWDSDLISDTIHLEDCLQKKLFTYSLPTKVMIKTVPQDAAVFSNYELLGYTPMFVDSNSDSITLKRNVELVHVDLKKFSNPIFIKDNSQAPEASFTETDFFKVLVGSAALLGGIAAYYKIKADNLYDDYKFGKNRENLDKVNRYDLYSGLAFGVLQINLGYLIYRFLSD